MARKPTEDVGPMSFRIPVLELNVSDRRLGMDGGLAWVHVLEPFQLGGRSVPWRVSVSGPKDDVYQREMGSLDEARAVARRLPCVIWTGWLLSNGFRLS